MSSMHIIDCQRKEKNRRETELTSKKTYLLTMVRTLTVDCEFSLIRQKR